MITQHNGWFGAFTRGTARDAIPSGVAIRKVNSEPGDAHPDGTCGVVLGSFRDATVRDGALVYFIEWDGHPRMAVGTMGWKVERA